MHELLPYINQFSRYFYCPVVLLLTISAVLRTPHARDLHVFPAVHILNCCARLAIKDYFKPRIILKSSSSGYIIYVWQSLYMFTVINLYEIRSFEHLPGAVHIIAIIEAQVFSVPWVHKNSNFTIIVQVLFTNISCSIDTAIQCFMFTYSKNCRMAKVLPLKTLF